MKYYEKIDGLRFVAIFFVLIEHFAYPILGRYVSAGAYGVDLFFVISGFLITSILLKPNDKSFGKNYINFLGRRTLRIFPLYYLTILILWLSDLDIVREKLIWLLTYTYNYAFDIYNFPNNPVNHFWSLCVEEQFYLFWPFIVLSFKKSPKILTVIISSIILFGYSQSFFNIIPSISKFNTHGLPTHMATLGLGAFGAILSTQKILPNRILKNAFFEYFILFFLIFNLISSFKERIFFIDVCSLYLILKAAHYNFSIKPINDFLKNKKVIKLGAVSYGAYLFHMPIGYYFTRYIFDPIWTNINFSSLGRLGKIQWHSWIIKFPLLSFLTFAIAFISFKYFETPILRLKDRYFKY